MNTLYYIQITPARASAIPFRQIQFETIYVSPRCVRVRQATRRGASRRLGLTDGPRLRADAHTLRTGREAPYFHPDHLGSITMLTNASGAIVTGVDMNNGGQSHLTYDPYGSINRANSDGPNIFRAKFNGREADPESGLLNYGARFYDPAIGRFTQPDSRIDALEPGGTDQYAYANNNPVAFNDPSGHNAVLHMFGQIVKHMVGAIRAAGTNIGNGVKNALSGGTFRRHAATLGNTSINKWNLNMAGESVKEGFHALGAGLAIFAAAVVGVYALVAAYVTTAIVASVAVQIVTVGIHMLAAAAAWLAVVATAIIRYAVMLVAAAIYAVAYLDALGLTGAIIGGIVGGIHVKGNYVGWDAEGARKGAQTGFVVGTWLEVFFAGLTIAWYIWTLNIFLKWPAIASFAASMLGDINQHNVNIHTREIQRQQVRRLIFVFTVFLFWLEDR